MPITKRIEWEQILPVWRDKLWPGRKSEIKPINGIKFMGGFDRNIEHSTPTFFGAFSNDELIGVNSGFRTDVDSYRSRGLYVEHTYRRQGIAQLLLHAIEAQAIFEGHSLLWSMPRATSMPAYLKFGFVRVSNFFDENVEFGPNCFASKYIREDDLWMT